MITMDDWGYNDSIKAREIAFMDASDEVRLEMIADGCVPLTDRVLGVAVQVVARKLLGRPLGKKGGE